MNKINEASYSRIYSHTRDNGTFAIIGSEDKDTGKDRYNELKSLIKKYEKKYGHLGYNKLSGTYQYKLTGKIAKEKSIIIYNISKSDALSIARKINQESIIWKDNTFFGIISVDDTILNRFRKSTLNFSKAIKQGIGSRLQSDQSRTFGYAFEGSKIMKRVNLSESILMNLKENKEDNWNDYLWYAENADEEMLCDTYYGGDWDEFENETAGHIATTILDTVGEEEFNRMVTDLRKAMAEEGHQKRTGPRDANEYKKWWLEQLKNKPNDVPKHIWSLILTYVESEAGKDLIEDYSGDEETFNKEDASQIAINILNNIGLDNLIKKVAQSDLVRYELHGAKPEDIENYMKTGKKNW